VHRIKGDVHRYNSRSFARLTKANVLTDLTALSKVPPAELTTKHEQEYNRLQQVNRDIRLEVRQSVRHVYRGAQQFSPEWRCTLQIRQLWQRVVAYKRRHRTGKQVKLTQIRRLMRATSIPNALSFNEHDTVSCLQAAKAAHYISVSNNMKLRDAYLITRDEAQAEANGSTVEIERKNAKLPNASAMPDENYLS
jgi:hypothetical protein